ncbi:nat9 [Symbiodinium natans]|uniref:Nat9 protein n=1 Tax=Symbiodinium natans TaxID=878477 RepID=A0A812HRR9_9DINO|nr:nat9 [Symbiodinium natans]
MATACKYHASPICQHCAHQEPRLNENTQLVGKACVLVPYEKSMVETYHEWMQDPELLELTGSEPLTLEEEHQMQQTWRESEDKLTFIVLDRSLPPDPEMGEAGVMGAMVGDVNVFFPQAGLVEEEGLSLYEAGEIEVMIAVSSSRRRGLAKEALGMLQDYCIEHLGTKHFVAKIKDHNGPSVALFERLGYRFMKHVEVFQELVYQLDVVQMQQGDSKLNEDGTEPA